MGVYDHPPPDGSHIGYLELAAPPYPILGVDPDRFLRQLSQLTRARDWIEKQLNEIIPE